MSSRAGFLGAPVPRPPPAQGRPASAGSPSIRRPGAGPAGSGVRRALWTLALAGALSCPCAGEDPPPPPELPPAESRSPALDWDRDFDLILELRQRSSGAESARSVRLEGLLKEREELQREERDLRERRGRLEATYLADEALAELMALEAGTIEQARAMLDKKIEGVRARLSDNETQIRRLRGGGR